MTLRSDTLATVTGWCFFIGAVLPALAAPQTDAAHPPNIVPSTGVRALAASSTAHSNRVCLAARPFYWEVGDRQSVQASGSEGAGSPNPSTEMPISTSSEWVFAAYVAQARGDKLTPVDIRALTMHSGYTNLQADRCRQLTPGAPKRPLTVSGCFHAAHLVGGTNGDYHGKQADHFYFDGGHYQWLAAGDPALKDLDATGLTSAIGNALKTGGSLTYESPLLDAGIRTTPMSYAGFLRRILSGELGIHDLLGAHAVCTNPSRCAQAASTPLPQTESPHYSLGSWVEDDPHSGDDAFSDPGLLGFYPWIDSSKTWYGVLARVSHVAGGYVGSMQCGRLIRKAWVSGKVQ